MKRRYVMPALIFIAALIVTNSTRLSSNSVHVAAGYVNDPVYPRTCANTGCHAGGVVLSAVNNLTLEIADSADYANNNLHTLNAFQYLPNTTYYIIFSIQLQPGNAYNGFQMTAIDTTTDSIAGLFTVINTANTYISTTANHSRQYIGHQNAGANTNWTYKWTSSQDTNAVEFYYNYVAAGINGTAQPQTYEGTAFITSALSTALPHVSLGNNQTVTHSGAVIELRAATFGGTAPYSYLWHTNPNTSNPLSCNTCDSAAMTVTFSANISVTVTDNINQTASATVNINLDTTTIDTAAPVPQQALCAVTCDSATGKNTVVWNPATGIDSFFIYRGNAANTLQQIAALPGTSNGIYYDVTAQPDAASYQYEINLKDTAGKYDSLSPGIQTIYLQYSGNGVLEWTPYRVGSDSAIANNYNIYRDSAGSGNWALLGTVATTSLTFTDADFVTLPNARYKITEPIAICNPVPAITEVTSNVAKLIPTVIKPQTLTAIRLYPNPASTQLAIDLAGFDAQSIIIYNPMGQKVKSIISTEGNIFTINVSNFAPGIYLVSAQSPVQVINMPLVILGK